MNERKRLEGRQAIAVAGPDASEFLRGLLTNGPPVDGTLRSALLTPQGKVLYDFWLTKSDAGYFIDIHQDAAAAFVKRLGLYRLRAKIDIAAADDAVIAARDALTRTVVTHDEAQGLEPYTDYDAERIALGAPEWGADYVSDEVFAMDVNLDALSGIDYKKGCFVGQEVASRMKRKGQARKRTLIASFDGAPPAPGAPVSAGDSTLGHIMSSHGDQALALIRLDRWRAAGDAGDAIMAGDAPLRLTLPDYLQAE